MVVGPGPGLQSSHDPVGHSQDEGVPGRSGDDHGSHVPDRQGIPELSGSTAHVAPDDGWQAQRGQASFLRSVAKLNKFRKSKVTMEVGGWVQISVEKKKLENRPQIKFCIYTFHASMLYFVCIYYQMLFIMI